MQSDTLEDIEVIEAPWAHDTVACEGCDKREAQWNLVCRACRTQVALFCDKCLQIAREEMKTDIRKCRTCHKVSIGFDQMCDILPL